MADLAEVIEGLRATLQSIPRLTAYDHVPGTVNFPAAVIIAPTGLEYDDLAEDEDDGDYTAVFEVALLVGSAIAENQRELIPLLDPRDSTSVFRRVQNDRSLGGLNVDAHVSGAPRRLTFDEVAAYKAWGQMVLVQVIVG